MKNKMLVLLGSAALAVCIVACGKSGREEVAVASSTDVCSMTFTAIDENGSKGYTIEALLENRSPNINYIFSIEGAYADSLNADPFFASEVAPGSKENAAFILNQEAIDYLEQDISSIELYVKITDADHEEEPPIYEDRVILLPKGSDANVKYKRKPEMGDKLLVDNENVKVTFLKAYSDELWGYSLLLYLENKTEDQKIRYSIEDCTVNTVAIDPFWATSLHGGKSGYARVAFNTDDFKKNGITDVEEITFTLKADSADEWSEDGLANEVVSIAP
ncbi:MAG: hypothetical protein MJ116_08535 [Lachnospiraceae bacterium]|nr:hypothetical protein [Lachnospiraceae bacterium]